MNHIIKNIFISLAILILFPLTASAAEVRLESNKIKIKTGEQFTVSIIVHSQESINALSGRLVFLPYMLEVKEIRDGNSSINFWIEKPYLEKLGAVSFSGITPGGFSGTNNLVFSVVFEAKKEGIAMIQIKDLELLLNDGEGTKDSAVVDNVAIFVGQGDSERRSESIIDKELPEIFSPVVSSDSALFLEKSFVVFATQDKNSGVSHYRIKEYRLKSFPFLSRWRIAQSPHVLADQALKSHIIIQAVDNAGNAQTVKIAPSHSLLWYEYLFYWGIIIAVALSIVILISKIWTRKNI